MHSTAHKFYIYSLFAIGSLLTLYFGLTGFEYYLLPLSERFWNENHEVLRPAGLIGHGLGIAGSLMLTGGVFLYMLRKRVRAFHRMGLLKHWLEFHIFLCTAGPVLIIYHTSFKFGGIVAVSFWCMIAVVLSGFVGRFIYGQIPRTIQGRELDIRELTLREKELSSDIEQRLDRNFLSEKLSFLNDNRRYHNITFFSSLKLVITDYLNSRKVISLIQRSYPEQGNRELLESVKNKIILSRQIALLRSMQNLFRNWHVIHLPFAIIMFIIMFVHIIVAILFGYTWMF